MSRPDSIGFFWQDIPQQRGARVVNRVMPEIPNTGWTAPTEFPRLDGVPWLGWDLETKDPDLTNDKGPGWARGNGHIVGISVCAPGYNRYFPIRHEVRPEENMNPEHVLAWARDTARAHGKRPVLGANLLYDFGWGEYEGIKFNGPGYDVQFAEALLDERAPTNLDDLGRKYLNRGKETNILYQWCADYYGGKPNESQRANIYRAPASLVGPYAEQDALMPVEIMPIQWREMEAQQLLGVFDLETRLIPLLLVMRRNGVRVDIDRATQVKDLIAANVRGLVDQLKQMVGHEVNPNASESIQKAFTSLGIPIPTKVNDKGNVVPCFDKDTLARVEHPVGELILTIRKRDKIRSTFIESYILDSHVNGKVFCSFHPLRSDRGGTRSGRFSSSNPNYQNVPSRDEELAPLVRSFFIPFEGHERWRRYDYSQIEYRMLAHYAIGPGSDELRAQYIADPNTDYHVNTQNLVTRFTGLEIPRKPIKNFNFGMTFGMGKGKMVRSTTTELKKLGGAFKLNGDQLYQAYHEACPWTKATMEHFANLAQSTGYVQTILGRRSRFDLWEPRGYPEDGVRQQALPYNWALNKYGGNIQRAYGHKALNRVLQGSGTGDTIKQAMVLCWESGVWDVTGVPVLTVHDELDFSDAGGNEDAWAYVKHTLEHAIPFRIPVIADLEMGPNWGQCS